MIIQIRYPFDSAEESERIFDAVKNYSNEYVKEVKNAVILAVSVDDGDKICYPILYSVKENVLIEAHEKAWRSENGCVSVGTVVTGRDGRPESYLFQTDDGETAFLLPPPHWGYIVQARLRWDQLERVFIKKAMIDRNTKVFRLTTMYSEPDLSSLEKYGLSQFSHAGGAAIEKARTQSKNSLFFEHAEDGEF